ncbi:MAG: phosphoribosylformylglycinamidine synthase subunit PurL, partial [Thermoleophilales bacterium]|nr:phosphoribosylformylglycinamidine synthase subunit PurL [Thermoleophilales bacterium]
ERLGREPNEVELAMFSLMWSEHCAYKRSKRLLGTLPTEGGRVVMGPGENAGAVSVGDGLVCAFKVESHNHPSAVEPFQGAATGVGGILRDVFAVGARPIAVLDSLRFGELDSARSRYLLDRAVAGIGHYGNSIGVATVGGEIYFEPSYEHNCLVNAMCLGVASHDRLIRSAAAGVGNHVVLFGALTGRDGIGGASVLASAELDEAVDKRPSVQIGDPF